MSFSLVAGGPFYRFGAALRLQDASLGRSGRLACALTAAAWVPLLLAVAAAGAPGAASAFWRDAETQARLLAAVPIMILAESFLHERQGHLEEHFLGRGLVAPQDAPEFERAARAARALRDGPAELVLLAVLLAADLACRVLAPGADSHAWGRGAGGALTPAGWWYALVGLPLFQFLICRWALRYFIWARLLWRASRLPLRLMPSHPDRAAGLGFLEPYALAFWPALFAQSALLAALAAERADGGAAFQAAAAALLVFAAAVVLGPLLFFSGRLAAARREGLRLYAALGDRGVREFEARWLAGAPREGLVERGELQSLSSLSPSFALVVDGRCVPFSAKSMVLLAAALALPWIPAALLAGRTLPVGRLLLKLLF